MQPDASSPRSGIFPGSTLRFKIGMVLLLTNVPVGYGGAALATLIGTAAGHSGVGVIVGAVLYGVSWLMFGLGLLLAGRNGVVVSRHLWNRWFRKSTPPPAPPDTTGPVKG